jgi:AraC-like DNA-binding protein
MATSDPVNPAWVQTALDHCQIALGADGLDSCLSAGRAFLGRTPIPRTHIEALILRGLLAEVMLRKGIELRALPPECVALLVAPVVSSLGAKSRVASHDVHPKVRRAIATMRRSYTNPDLSLCDLASRVGLTSSHLSRLLHKETMLGFVGHLRGIRLKKAVTLMKRDAMSVKEIAASVGYKYSGDFARDFKVRYGVTPSVWRKRAA